MQRGRPIGKDRKGRSHPTTMDRFGGRVFHPAFSKPTRARSTVQLEIRMKSTPSTARPLESSNAPPTPPGTLRMRLLYETSTYDDYNVITPLFRQKKIITSPRRAVSSVASKGEGRMQRAGRISKRNSDTRLSANGATRFPTGGPGNVTQLRTE